MYDLGQFFNIDKPFEKASFGVIVDIDEEEPKYHVFLYDEDKNLLETVWVSEASLVELENNLIVGNKVRMVDDIDGANLNSDAIEAEYGIVTKVDKEDIEGMPYIVRFYKHNGEWIDYWCSGKQLQKVEG